MNIQPVCGTDTGLPSIKKFRQELSDLQHDAVRLHALTQGAVELYDGVQTAVTPAASALHVLLEVIVERAERLNRDLNCLEMKMGAK